MWTVKTSTQFHQKLIRALPNFKNMPTRSTLEGWFKFSGACGPEAFPVPTETWLTNYSVRCNMRLRMTTGRIPKLRGCEAAMDKAATFLRNTRSKTVPLSTVQVCRLSLCT
jgi:hypothetical protein